MIDVIEALKSPTIILLLSTSPLRLLILMGLGVPLILGAWILRAVTPFCWADPFITVMPIQSLSLLFLMKYCYRSFLITSICMVYLFLSLHFQSVFRSEVTLVGST